MKIKLQWKTLIIPVLIVMVVVGLVGNCDHLNTINSINSALRSKDVQLRSWRDESSRNHAVIQSLQASRKVLVITHQKELDSLKSPCKRVEKMKLKK